MIEVRPCQLRLIKKDITEGSNSIQQFADSVHRHQRKLSFESFWLVHAAVSTAGQEKRVGGGSGGERGGGVVMLLFQKWNGSEKTSCM